jgi:hypothetical protein
MKVEPALAVASPAGGVKQCIHHGSPIDCESKREAGREQLAQQLGEHEAEASAHIKFILLASPHLLVEPRHCEGEMPF